MRIFINEEYLIVDEVLLYLSVYEYHDDFALNFWYLEGCKYERRWIAPWETRVVLMHSKGKNIQHLFPFKKYKYQLNWYYTEVRRLHKRKRNFFLLHWKRFMIIYRWLVWRSYKLHRRPFNFYCNELYFLQDFKREFITHLHHYKKSVNFIRLERNAVYNMCIYHGVYGWNMKTRQLLGAEALLYFKWSPVGQHFKNINPARMCFGYYLTDRWITYVYYFFNNYKPYPLTFYGYKYSYTFFNIHFISLELEDFFLNKENSLLKTVFFYINFYNSFFFFYNWFWKIISIFTIYWSMLLFIYYFNTRALFNFFFYDKLFFFFRKFNYMVMYCEALFMSITKSTWKINERSTLDLTSVYHFRLLTNKFYKFFVSYMRSKGNINAAKRYFILVKNNYFLDLTDDDAKFKDFLKRFYFLYFFIIIYYIFFSYWVIRDWKYELFKYYNFAFRKIANFENTLFFSKYYAYDALYERDLYYIAPYEALIRALNHLQILVGDKNQWNVEGYDILFDMHKRDFLFSRENKRLKEYFRYFYFRNIGTYNLELETYLFVYWRFVSKIFMHKSNVSKDGFSVVELSNITTLFPFKDMSRFQYKNNLKKYFWHYYFYFIKKYFWTYYFMYYYWDKFDNYFSLYLIYYYSFLRNSFISVFGLIRSIYNFRRWYFFYFFPSYINLIYFYYYNFFFLD